MALAIHKWRNLSPSATFYSKFDNGMTTSGKIVTSAFTLDGQKKIEGVRFGVPKTLSEFGENILGLDYRDGERADYQYTNFPQVIKDQGLNKTASYNLWLNTVSASHGSALFGGISTSNFKGKPTTLRSGIEGDRYKEFDLEVKGVPFADKKLIENLSISLD